MKRKEKIEKFRESLEKAVKWEHSLSDHEKGNLTYSECIDISVKRVLDEYALKLFPKRTTKKETWMYRHWNDFHDGDEDFFMINELFENSEQFSYIHFYRVRKNNIVCSKYSDGNELQPTLDNRMSVQLRPATKKGNIENKETDREETY